MSELIDALIQAALEVRQFVTVYDDAADMPGRRPDVDADGTGRMATRDPGRPTEATALDERRTALQAELKNGAEWLAYAVAATRGVSASMDRALLQWEGEDTALHFPGGTTIDHRNGAAGQ
ncbi:DUF7169 domain-containing protein [Streptomyces sp. MH60]|uniref:DUF7169 domain-containing protein n=1 Tax=Streptomyces sp. MH60 TaxID=1940758 RepID=UPI0010574843|nr:hypothetical protein [Streptomyces sp. MH60]